jgi:hypothetical protein
MNRATIGKYTVEAFNDVYSVNSIDITIRVQLSLTCCFWAKALTLILPYPPHKVAVAQLRILITKIEILLINHRRF